MHSSCKKWKSLSSNAIFAFLTWNLIVEHKHIGCLSFDYIGS